MKTNLQGFLQNPLSEEVEELLIKYSWTMPHVYGTAYQLFVQRIAAWRSGGFRSTSLSTKHKL